MLNNLVLVGRLVSDPEINETEKGKVTDITLAVPRSYKNEEGEYETDFIPVKLFGQIASTNVEYCRKGDLIGVKGRLVRLNDKDLKVVAEKITFLSSKPRED